MSECYKYERSLFSYEEFEPVHKTHHPFIYDLDIDELSRTCSDLRSMREKERTLARQRSREVRGKTEPRGSSFPSTADQPRKRKQVLSAALKRVNKELKRQLKLQAKSRNVEAARLALALRKEANFGHHPQAGVNYSEGIKSLPSRRRRWVTPKAKVGSISQMTRNAQAARDSRGELP